MNPACGSSLVQQGNHSVEPSLLQKHPASLLLENPWCFDLHRSEDECLHYSTTTPQHHVKEKLHGFESVYNCHCRGRHGGCHVGHVHDERATGWLARLWAVMHANRRAGTADLILQDATAIRVPREKSAEQWSLASRLQRHLSTLMPRLPGPCSRTLPARPTGTPASRSGRSGRLSKRSHSLHGRLPRVRALHVHAHRVLRR